MEVSTAVQAPDYAVRTEEAAKPATAYIFTAMDSITQDVKHKNPGWRKGGALRPDYRTLMYLTGYIERGRIVEMRQQMESAREGMFEPTVRKHMPKTYRVNENGQERQIGIVTQQSPVTGEIEQVHDGLLRHAIYPSDDIEILTGKLDGIVKMPVRTRAEAAAAEAFLYPEGISLPTGLAQTRAYFEGRKAVATNEFQLAVAEAALKSCDQYETWALGKIDEQNSRYDEHKGKGWPFSYSPESLMCFDQLGIPRRDNVDRAAQGRIDEIARKQDETNATLGVALNRIADIFAGQQPQESKSEVSPQPPAPEAVTEESNLDNLSKTPTDPIPDSPTFAINDPVFVGDMPGKVIGKPFGKITVELSDGEKVTVEKDAVSSRA